MSKQEVMEFWAKVSSDQELARKLEAAVKPESGWDAVVEFANANGFDFTTADYGEAVRSLPKAVGAEGFMEWKKRGQPELSDSELDKVAGGAAVSSFLSSSRALSYSSPLRKILQPYGGLEKGVFTQLA
jgi:predicted ribosomally synthesized peptide with nif11-like leader